MYLSVEDILPCTNLSLLHIFKCPTEAAHQGCFKVVDEFREITSSPEAQFLHVRIFGPSLKYFVRSEQTLFEAGAYAHIHRPIEYPLFDVHEAGLLHPLLVLQWHPDVST